MASGAQGRTAPACESMCVFEMSADIPTHASLPLLPAGLTGLLLALGAQQQAAQAPIVNLREVNPYVASAVEDWRRRHGLAAALPRQHAPLPAAAAGSSGSSPAAAGTSSFGMSGVNAHMLLSPAAADEGSVAAADVQPLPRHRQRHWPAPAAHPLLEEVGAAGGTARFSCSFVGVSAAFLRDHCVSGRLLVPATAFFELLLAAAGSAAKDGTKQLLLPSLAGVAILTPKLLSQQAAAAGGDAVQVALHLSGGAAEVVSADGSTHVRGAVCAMPAAPLLPSPAHGAIASRVRQLLVSSQFSSPAPQRYNFAGISAASACPSGSGWHAQPAAADAALHLAAVKVAGLTDSASRVPVAVAAVAAPARGGSPEQWSASELPGLAPDGSALCTIRAQLASSWLTTAGLHSKPLPSKKAAVDAAAEAMAFEQRNFTYAVQWQAAAGAEAAAPTPALVPIARCGGMHLLADAAAACGAQGSLDAGLGAAKALAISARQRSNASATAVAASSIELLQRILAAGGSAPLQAQSAVALPSPSASQPGSTAAVLAAALKVAAVENPGRQWAALSVDAQQAQLRGAPASAADQHGALLSAGALCRPKLLRQPM